MKNLKKLIAVMLCMVMAPGVLAGCGSDPVAEEYERYMNVEMVEVNANYDEMTAEVGRWENFTTNEEYADSINNVLLPNVNESLDILSKMELETEEVKAIKDKFETMIETYKKGYELLQEAVKTDDEAAVDAAMVKLEEALSRLDEYNAALEELADKTGLTVEY